MVGLLAATTFVKAPWRRRKKKNMENRLMRGPEGREGKGLRMQNAETMRARGQFGSLTASRMQHVKVLRQQGPPIRMAEYQMLEKCSGFAN